MGTKALNIETPWDFVEKFYQNYSSSEDIAKALDLDILRDHCFFGNAFINDAATELLNSQYRGEKNDPQIEIDRHEIFAQVYHDSIQGFIEKIKSAQLDVFPRTCCNCGDGIRAGHLVNETDSYCVTCFNEKFAKKAKKMYKDGTQYYTEWQIEPNETASPVPKMETITYYLFGQEATKVLSEDGIDALIDEVENNNMTAAIYAHNEAEGSVVILQQAAGWTDYSIITKDQYYKLADYI